MKCKYHKIRSKKYQYYGYCTKFKKEVSLYCKECKGNIEYKEQKTLKSHTNKQAKREKERFSIIYRDLTKCCNCGSKIDIEKNEVFEGSYRQTSIKYGMVCPFCKTCHSQFHNDIMFNLFYKVMFEKEFLKTHSKEEFIKIFGQDYIFKLEQKKRS
jgi:hypothetical protein|nr:MAG TPA_asm: zinc-ribbon family protein [Caudoviricetes sp.]